MYSDRDGSTSFEERDRRRRARRERRAQQDGSYYDSMLQSRVQQPGVRSTSTRSSSSRARTATRRQDERAYRREASRKATSERARREREARYNEGHARRTAARRSSLSVPVLVGMLVGVIVLALLMHHMLRLRVTVNGKTAHIWSGSTVERLVKDGLAEPTPGNLLAVDGTILSEGEGNICTATINGESVAPDTKVHRGDDVTIADGDDKTEEADVTKEAIPFGTASGSRDFGAYWQGSIHLLSDGEEGVQETRTGKVSGKTVTETVVPPKDNGYSIYTAQPSDKVVALTFDDGPWPTTTSQILDILEQYGAKATFFTIGNQIQGQEDLIKREAALGCQVCTHTWDHAAGSGGGVSIVTMSKDEQIQEVQKGYQAIKEVLGEEPKHIMRAPGGNFYGDAIDNLWPYVDAEIGWDVDTEDWSLPGTDIIAARIASASAGQVVLMHDGGGDRSQTVEALAIALPQLVDAGYSFVTVDELLAYGMPGDTATTTADETASVA